MLGQKTLKFFPAVPFFHESQRKYLSECTYSKKPPLPSKIPDYAIEIPVYLNTLLWKNQFLMLLSNPAQHLQNCSGSLKSGMLQN